jgi:hypothetical protein
MFHTHYGKLHSYLVLLWPLLWSSGQSSWLQIQRSTFDSWCYQIFWEVVGLKRGPLSLVSTTEELLRRKSSSSGPENWEYVRGDPSCWQHGTLHQQTLALTSLTSGGRSVSIGRSRTQARESVCCLSPIVLNAIITWMDLSFLSKVSLPYTSVWTGNRFFELWLCLFACSVCHPTFGLIAMNLLCNLHRNKLQEHCQFQNGSNAKTCSITQQTTNKLHGPSPRVNYTDWTTVKLVPTFVDRGCHMVCMKDPYDCILGFLDWNRYFFFQVAPQLYSWGWVDPVPDPLLLRKSGSAGNRNRDLWICSQKLWPLDHRGGLLSST